QPLDGCGIDEVALDDAGAAALRDDVRGKGIGLRAGSVAMDRHGEAGIGELLDDGAADSPGPAGDKRNLSHRAALRLWRRSAAAAAAPSAWRRAGSDRRRSSSRS